MTNDEVSDWLYRIRSKAEVFMSEDQNAKAKEAVALAIKALEKPKMGKWIFHKPFDNVRKNCNECIECSQCHIWLGYDCYAKTPYCPNCGAKMEAENDK